jgi:hypothetical protein
VPKYDVGVIQVWSQSCKKLTNLPPVWPNIGRRIYVCPVKCE